MDQIKHPKKAAACKGGEGWNRLLALSSPDICICPPLPPLPPLPEHGFPIFLTCLSLHLFVILYLYKKLLPPRSLPGPHLPYVFFISHICAAFILYIATQIIDSVLMIRGQISWEGFSPVSVLALSGSLEASINDDSCHGTFSTSWVRWWCAHTSVSFVNSTSTYPSAMPMKAPLLPSPNQSQHTLGSVQILNQSTVSFSTTVTLLQLTPLRVWIAAISLSLVSLCLLFPPPPAGLFSTQHPERSF